MTNQMTGTLGTPPVSGTWNCSCLDRLYLSLKPDRMSIATVAYNRDLTACCVVMRSVGDRVFVTLK